MAKFQTSTFSCVYVYVKTFTYIYRPKSGVYTVYFIVKEAIMCSRRYESDSKSKNRN